MSAEQLHQLSKLLKVYRTELRSLEAACREALWETEGEPKILNLPTDPLYRTVVADPSWSFSDKGSRAAPDQKSKRAKGKGYDTLPNELIASMPIQRFLHPEGSHLYLWVPDALLEDGLYVMRSWGFTLKFAFKWNKRRAVKLDKKDVVHLEHKGRAGALTNCGSNHAHLTGPIQIGQGHYARRGSELCLFGVRGKCPRREGQPTVHDVIDAPRRKNTVTGEKHSTKPIELLELAEKLSHSPYIELFARSGRPGWTSWGNQVRVGEP